MYSDDELLPLSGLQHLSFCERQWALIHVEQLWSDSDDTLRGQYFHERVDAHGYSVREGVRCERMVRLVSHTLGIYGVADLVEFAQLEDELSIVPVEYKVGRPKRSDWDRLQVAAQALCLEEMYGVRIERGALFYGETRRKETVIISDTLRGKTNDMCGRMHLLFDQGTTPRAKRTRKCSRCSLQDQCVPELIEKDVVAYWRDKGEGDILA